MQIAMEKMYNYFTKILWMSVAALLILACDTGDDQQELNTALLFGKQWKLVTIFVSENGQEFEDPILTCEQDNAIEFKSDKVFVRHNGANKCNQEADSETSQWSIFQDPKVLIFENIEYQILDLSTTNLDVQRSLQGTNGDVIVKYYYTSL